MNKGIVILSGVPSGKSRFTEIAMERSWLWSINAKDFLADLSKKIGWDGVKDDKHYKFIVELLTLANSYYGFESNYLEDKIKSFRDDESETKSPRDSDKVFTKFLLVIHGVSKELIPALKEDTGAFKVHIMQGTRREYDEDTNEKRNVIPESDFVLFEGDEDFEQQVLTIVNKLTNK